ncbi:MAG: hypothetical protein IPJ65_12225 [Archangiaceae bacterium]|nr:hypothetical protein [Archangiaceae bacterium]
MSWRAAALLAVAASSCIDFDGVEAQVCSARPDLCGDAGAVGGGAGGASGGTSTGGGSTAGGGGAGGGAGGSAGAPGDAGLAFRQLDGGSVLGGITLATTLPGGTSTGQALLVNTGAVASGPIAASALETDGGPSALFTVDTAACGAGLAAGATCVVGLGLTAPVELNQTTLLTATARAVITGASASATVRGTAFDPDAGTLVVDWVDAGPGSRVWFDDPALAPCDSPAHCVRRIARGTSVTRVVYPARGFGISTPTTSSAAVSFTATGATQTLLVAVGPANRVFATSALFFPADLGASGTPRSTATALCQAIAADAGLPGNYRAYFGTGNTDPDDAIEDAGARGFVRTDGLPVFSDIAISLGGSGLVPNRVWYPIRLDEHGQRVSAPYEVMVGATNTNPQNDCSGFTVTTDGGAYRAGSVIAGNTAQGWRSGSRTCDLPAHLYCFGVDARVRVFADPPPGAKRAFYTGIGYETAGNGGLAALDQKCALAAGDAALFGTFVAFVPPAGMSAMERFDAGGPWVRLDGPMLLEPGMDLNAPGFEWLTPTERNALNQDVFTGVGSSGWSGALSPGARCDGGSDCCNGWTGGSGYFGAGIVDVRWRTARVACGATGGTVCFER